MDIYDSKKRSDIMRNIKSSGNASTEGKIIAFFRSHNIVGWRRKYKIYGKPDIVFCKQKIAIFFTVAFGMGMTVEIQFQSRMQNFGKRNANVIFSVTQMSQNIWKTWDGLSFVYGNAN